MKYKIIKTVLGVIVGICLFSLFGSLFTQIANFVMYDYLIENKNANVILLTDIKWTSLALGLLIIPVIVSYILSFMEKGKAYKITAAALSAVTFATAIVFMDIIRKDAEFLGGNSYAAGIAYLPEMMQIAIPCFIMGVISVVALVLQSSRRGKTECVDNVQESVKEKQYEESL